MTCQGFETSIVALEERCYKYLGEQNLESHRYLGLSHMFEPLILR